MEPARSITQTVIEVEKRLANCLKQMQSAVEIYQHALVHNASSQNVQPAVAQAASKASSTWEKAISIPLKDTQDSLYKLEALLNQKRFLKMYEPHPIGRLESDQLDFEADFIHIKPESDKDEYDQLQLCQVFEHQRKFVEAALAYKILAEKLILKNRLGLALRCMKKSYSFNMESQFPVEHHSFYGKLLVDNGYAKLKLNHYLSAYNNFNEALPYFEKAKDTNVSSLETVKLDMAKLRIKHQLIREAFEDYLKEINNEYFGIFEDIQVVLYYPEDKQSEKWVQNLFASDLGRAGFNIRRSNNRPRGVFDTKKLPFHENTLTAKFGVLIMSTELASNYRNPTYSDPLVHQLRMDDKTIQKQSDPQGILFDYIILTEKNIEIPWPQFLDKAGAVKDFTKQDHYYEQLFQLMHEMLSITSKNDLEAYPRIKSRFDSKYKEILSSEISSEAAQEYLEAEEEKAREASKVKEAPSDKVRQFFQNLMKS